MMIAPVVPLEFVDLALAQHIGAKAYNLARIKDIAEVPKAVCLTAAFCAPIFARLGSDAATLGEPAERLLKPEEYASLCDAVGRLGGGLVSVRSSFAGEDGAVASFAGMFLSRLNITAPLEVADAVVEVIRSAAAPRAVTYGSWAGQQGPPIPAVLLQQMLAPEVSGVMFTASPFGNPGEAVIEASYGLGEAIVSGAITPDLFVLSRRDEHVTHREMGTKRRAVRGRPGGGTEVEDVVEADRSRFCLTEADAVRLLQIGFLLEQRLGGPQDVEFAFERGKLWILQTRPVTARR